MKKVLALSLILSTLLMSSFSLFEPAISVASSASDASTIITLNVDEGIAITDAPDTSMSQHLSMSNNTAIASTTWNVKTNAVAGYTLKIHATGVASGGTTAYVVAGAGTASYDGTYVQTGVFPATSTIPYYKVSGQEKYLFSDGTLWYLETSLAVPLGGSTLAWSAEAPTNLNWDDAAAYCTGIGQSLPTLAQLISGLDDQFIHSTETGFVADATYWSSTAISYDYGTAYWNSGGGYTSDSSDGPHILHKVRCVTVLDSPFGYKSIATSTPPFLPADWLTGGAVVGPSPSLSLTSIGGAFTGRAMTSASSSIPDFATSAATWSSLAASSAAFGFSVIGSDAITGTYGTASDCGTGHTANTSLNYRGFSGDTDVNVSTRTSTTTPSGIDSTVCYAVEQKGIYVPSGVYTATVVATAVTQ